MLEGTGRRERGVYSDWQGTVCSCARVRVCVSSEVHAYASSLRTFTYLEVSVESFIHSLADPSTHPASSEQSVRPCLGSMKMAPRTRDSRSVLVPTSGWRTRCQTIFFFFFWSRPDIQKA